jgi:hypothetical protein
LAALSGVLISLVLSRLGRSLVSRRSYGCAERRVNRIFGRTGLPLDHDSAIESLGATVAGLLQPHLFAQDLLHDLVGAPPVGPRRASRAHRVLAVWQSAASTALRSEDRSWQPRRQRRLLAAGTTKKLTLALRGRRQQLRRDIAARHRPWLRVALTVRGSTGGRHVHRRVRALAG